MVVFETVKSDDFIEYFIFPDITNIPEAKVHQYLNDILQLIIRFVQPYTKFYIWQKDKFTIVPKYGAESEDLPPHLYGISYYGDNIEDEWFIVFLLLEISKQLTDIFIRVVDIDGEFLLIEAAEYLPNSIQPENSNGKVYIWKGSVTIIPPELGGSKDCDVPVGEIVTNLRNNFPTVEENKIVTDAIIRRTERFKNQIHELQHCVRACIPAKVAALLTEDPNLIAPAVTAFCQRDILDVKVCRRMINFPPKDRVMRLVTFTKCLYAMISQQVFMPSKCLNWTIPNVTDLGHKEYLLGYKIACGFEILASQHKDNGNCVDLSTDKNWHNYNNALKQKGYYKDNIPGSKNYCELEKNAQKYYLENLDRCSDQKLSVVTLLSKLNYNVEQMRNEESTLPPSDDESWMNINEQDFDIILQQKFGIADVTNKAESLTNVLNKFLKSTSHIDGVQTPNSLLTKSIDDNENYEDGDSTDNTSSDDDEKDNNAVTFDPDEFFNYLKKIADGPSDATEPEISDKFDECYSNQMEEELATTTMAESFVKKEVGESNDERLNSVDVNVNALQNLKLSFEQQFGGPGPVGNLFNYVGLAQDPAMENH